MPVSKTMTLAIIFAAMATCALAQAQDARPIIEKIYDPETKTIHLNPDDPTADLVFQKRDFSQDKREAGPINVQRYNVGLPNAGIPTFFKLPIAVTPEDLEAGEVDVAIVGNSLTASWARPGTHLAPAAVRMGEILAFWGVPQPHAEVLIDPFEDLTTVDYGDIAIDPYSVERSAQHMADIVEEIARTGAIPFIVGGDHSSFYPAVTAMTRVYGKESFTAIHIDAHLDNTGPLFGHYFHNANSVRVILEEGLVKGEDLMHLGMHNPGGSDRDTVNWYPRNNAHLYTMAEFRRRGFETVLRDIAEIVRSGPGKVHISLDHDAIDPAYMPALAAPELGGFTSREMIEILRTITMSADLIGIEFIEYNPLLDTRANASALLVSRLIRETLAGVALRRSGITEPIYYAPEMITETRNQLLGR